MNAAFNNNHSNGPYGQDMYGHPNGQYSHGIYDQRTSNGSRTHLSMDEDDAMVRLNTQLNSRSRRNSVVSFKPNQYQDEMMFQQNQWGAPQDMNMDTPMMGSMARQRPMILPNQTVDPNMKLQRLEAWLPQHSTDSEASDEDRSRTRSRANSVASYGGGRPRSRSSGSRFVDLSKRNTFSSSSGGYGGPYAGPGKIAYNMNDNMSEEDMMSMQGHHDQRLMSMQGHDQRMMHQGMGIDRNSTRTPFQPVRR